MELFGAVEPDGKRSNTRVLATIGLLFMLAILAIAFGLVAGGVASWESYSAQALVEGPTGDQTTTILPAVSGLKGPVSKATEVFVIAIVPLLVSKGGEIVRSVRNGRG